MTFVKKHISIRVLWHDTGWNVCVCANPRLNGSCLKLNRIGQDEGWFSGTDRGGRFSEIPKDRVIKIDVSL